MNDRYAQYAAETAIRILRKFDSVGAQAALAGELITDGGYFDENCSRFCPGAHALGSEYVRSLVRKGGREKAEALVDRYTRAAANAAGVEAHPQVFADGLRLLTEVEVREALRHAATANAREFGTIGLVPGGGK